MRAMILTQQKGVDESPLAQREMDAPRIGPGEVRVKVSVCAVCRTDIHPVRAFNVSATVASSECSVPTVMRCCRSSSKGGS